MMKLFAGMDTANGLAGLLASVCVLLALQLLFKVGEFLWNMKREKDKVSETTVAKLVEAVRDLECEIKKATTAVSELPKLKLDLRRLYLAAKILAGDRWPEVRDEFMNEINGKDM